MFDSNISCSQNCFASKHHSLLLVCFTSIDGKAWTSVLRSSTSITWYPRLHHHCDNTPACQVKQNSQPCSCFGHGHLIFFFPFFSFCEFYRSICMSFSMLFYLPQHKGIIYIRTEHRLKRLEAWPFSPAITFSLDNNRI